MTICRGVRFEIEPGCRWCPLLAAASTVTSKIALGPLVTSPNFRHPLLLAKDLITLDDLSGGRLIIGVGAGGRGFDATVFGGPQWSNAERHERFKEFTGTLDQLLRESESTIAGPTIRLSSRARSRAPATTETALLVSALGRRASRSRPRSVTVGSAWVGCLSGREVRESAVREQSDRLDEALELIGRTTRFERLFLDGQNDESPTTSYERFIDWAERYRALRFSELVIHYPVADSIFDYDLALFERIASEGRETLEA